MISFFRKLKKLGKRALRSAPIPAIWKEKLLFILQLGYWPNFRAPSSFCEKLHARKLLERDERLVPLSDKVKVRDYVAKMIGKEYLIPLRFSGTRLEPEELHALGDNLIVKRNDDCGSAFPIHQNTLPRAREACQAMASAETYGTSTNEWWYNEISPQILVEHRLFDSEQPDFPIDYKFFVFASKTGEPNVVAEVVRRNRSEGVECAFFDTEMNPLFFDGERVFYRGSPLLSEEFPAKDLFAEMKAVAVKLADGFDFVRVDLYAIAGKVYFGEMTFNPAEGRFRVSPVEFDFELGKKWEMPVPMKGLQTA